MTPVVVRYDMSFRIAAVLFDVAVMVKIFFDVLYTDEVIATVSVNTTGFTVMLVFEILDPATFVAVSERLIIVLVTTAGAV